jgi:hypothetical protein
MEPTHNPAHEAGMPYPVSLGEQSHDAIHCVDNGRPHLGPCIEPGSMVEEPSVGVTLRQVAKYLIHHGWIQGAYYDASSGSFTPPACLVGGLGAVCYGGPVDAPAEMFGDPGFDRFETTLTYLDAFLTARFDMVSYRFNDARGRSFPAIVYALLAAADEWSVEHGEHTGEAHQPGSDDECPVCEAKCFCRDGVVCVRCQAEYWAGHEPHSAARRAGIGDGVAGGAA